MSGVARSLMIISTLNSYDEPLSTRIAMSSAEFRKEYTTIPNTLKTMRLPENEPRFKRRSMKPAVEVRKAITVHAKEEWITLSHNTDWVLAVVS